MPDRNFGNIRHSRLIGEVSERDLVAVDVNDVIRTCSQRGLGTPSTTVEGERDSQLRGGYPVSAERTF